MPSFFQRYQEGDRVAVWRDLTELGAAVREKEHLADAQAVARETMRRAAQNVETILTRLQTLGYEFITPEIERHESGQSAGQALDFARALAAMPTIQQQQQSPHISGMLSMIERLGGMMQKHAPAPVEPPKVTDPLRDRAVWSRPENLAAVRKELDRAERKAGGPLPLSLRAWCEEVGALSLIGSHPRLGVREGRGGQKMRMYFGGADLPGMESTMQPYRTAAEQANIEITGSIAVAEPTAEGWPGNGDALVVQPQFSFLGEDGDGLILSPDSCHKLNVSGGDPYSMAVPNPGADAPFDDGHGRMFVDYLRVAFRNGGFPGFENAKRRPEKELAFLSAGLLEI